MVNKYFMHVACVYVDLYPCVYGHTCVQMHMHECLWAFVPVEAWRCSSPCSVSRASPNPILTGSNYSSLPACPEGPLSLPPNCWNYMQPHPYPAFYVYSGHLNSSPHTHIASNLFIPHLYHLHISTNLLNYPCFVQITFLDFSHSECTAGMFFLCGPLKNS